MKLFNRLKSLSKLQLVLLIAVFAAIPVTVGGVVTYRLVSPQAATGKPTSLTPAYSANTQTPTFRWDCFCYTTKYRVHLREGDGNFFAGSWYKDVAKGSSNITSTSYSGFSNNNYKAVPSKLEFNKTYYWTVSCVTGGCNTATTMAFTVIDNQAPSVPTGVRIDRVLGLKSIGLTHNLSTDNVGVVSYDWLRTDNNGQTYSWTNHTGWASPYTEDNQGGGLRYGLIYTYKVRATDGAGNKSGWSNQVVLDKLGRDDDNDGFYNAQEEFYGTRTDLACGINAWPPDLNNDGSVNSVDQLLLSRNIGNISLDNYSFTSYRRFDLDINWIVDNPDLNVVSANISKKCS